MRKALLPLLCLILLLPATALTEPAATAPPEASEAGEPLESLGGDYMLLNEAGGRGLWVNLMSGDVAVRGGDASPTWHTFPPDLDARTDVSRDMKNQLLSHLVVTYLDASLNEVTVNSAACVE